jgi:hypothetical protein
MSSIYLRYSPVPVVVSQSYEKDSFRNEDGELITPNFPNQWGSYTTSFASSGWISLAAGSGIFLNTPGYVDASGLRVNSILAQTYNRIDSEGQIIPLYNGSNGGLLYKQTNDVVNTIPDFVYNTGINKLTSPSGIVGHPFYVSPGSNPNSPTREIAQFIPLELIPQITIPGEGGTSITTPAEVNISGANFFTSNIIIGTGGNEYKNTILTHQGADAPAEWIKADYLQADGALWNRYPKRAVRIENNRIIFYNRKPKWAILSNNDDYEDFDLAVLEKEFGNNDTIALIDAETLVTEYIKPALTITYPYVDSDPDTSFSPVFESQIITDVGSPPESYEGYAMSICPGASLVEESDPNSIAYKNGYAFSVKKGAYLTMQLGPDATGPWACADFPENSGYRFKPSTANTISIRPNIHTAFNMLAENIDFLIYGQYFSQYDNYEANIFGLNANNIPSGLTPAFMVDANISNAVSGTIGSGVIFQKYLDRAKTIPSGYLVDETPKVCINTNKPYTISSIVSGLGFLSNYSSLTVSGVTFSNSILTEEIYLTPRPSTDNSGKYIANALLTLNAAGQIVSRQPRTNPTVPDKPINIEILILGNNEFSIKWVAGEDGGSTVVNYIIEFSVNNGNTWTEVPSGQILRGSNDQKSCTIIGLETSIQYLFRVKSQNSVGVSSGSLPSSPVQSNNSVPQSPKDFVYTRFFGENSSEIELSWREPDSEGLSQISGYIIEESDNNGMSWVYYNSPSSPIVNTSEMIYGLTNEINYLYRISAINDSGQGTFNFVYSTGNVIVDSILEEEEKKKSEDVLSNWDFGSILFTGVCST